MRVDFSQINHDDFNVSIREHEDIGQVVMITPSLGKHRWELSETPFRSLMCSPDGKVLSAGFHKFFNYGEYESVDAVTQQQIISENVVYAEKMDGSLLIRSVINGAVHLRTRGSHTLGDGFKEEVEGLIAMKYPRLMDPTLYPEYSLLFEYTSPDNLVVLRYDEPRLTALGTMSLFTNPVEFHSSPETVKEMEDTFGTPAVKFRVLSGSIAEVIDQVRGWKGSEGVVVWSHLPNGKMHLAKIKAAEYIRIHSVKFQLTKEKIKKLCWYKGIDTLDRLKDEFFRLGVDWEAISFIEPIFFSYIHSRNEATKMVNTFIDQVVAEGVENYKTRKEKALKIKEIAGSNRALFSLGMQYVLGHKYMQEYIDSITLEVSVKRLTSYRKEAEALAEYI